MNEMNLSALQQSVEGMQGLNGEDGGNPMDNIQNIVHQGMGQGIDDGSFIWGIFFGIIGMSYSMYGKKSDKDMFLYSGVGLMAYTYFATGMTQTLAIGLVLTAIPFIIKK